MAPLLNRRSFLILALLCGALGCGGKTGVAATGGVGGIGGMAVGGGGGAVGDGSAGNVSGGDAGTGGMGVGGAGIGDAASGGKGGMDAAASAGSGSGGFVTGGVATGGSGFSGTGTGGFTTGDVGGTVAAGGSGFAGTGAGGARTGGAAAGGAHSGGTHTGGTGTGGAGGTTGAGTGGTPAEALLDLDGSRMAFDPIPLGTTRVATFTLTNRGASASGVPSIRTETKTYPTGTPNPVTVTGCGAALPPGGSCTLTIVVTPPKLGLFEATVSITADPGTVRPASSSVSIYVVGWVIGFEVSTPSPIQLDDLAPGISVRRSITVTALIDLTDLAVGTSSEDVAIDAAATTCTPALAKGASCGVTVEFNASAIGWKRAVVGIRAGGDMGQFVGIEIRANVTRASDLGIEPKAPAPYSCVHGQTSPPVVFTVTNLGATTSGPITSAIVSESTRCFTITGTDCTVLAAQATCTISVVCNPSLASAAAAQPAILSVSDGNTHLSVPLIPE